MIASVNADKSSNLTRAGHLHQASKGLNSEVDVEVDKFKISSDEKKQCILGTKLPNRENLDKSVCSSDHAHQPHHVKKAQVKTDSQIVSLIRNKHI